MFRLLALLYVFASPPVQAQSNLEPTSTPFTERLTERVPVAGRSLVGVISVPGEAPPAGTGLASGVIALPAKLAAPGAPICVHATTQDGRYSADNTFEAQGRLPSEGRASLDWPSVHPDTLRGFALSELGVLARRGPCTNQSEILPVFVGPGNQLGTIQVLVNTRGGVLTAALRDLDAGRTLRRANCGRVEGAARVAFDARCVFGPVADLPARVQLRLEEVSRDGLQNELLESFVLRLAGPLP